MQVQPRGCRRSLPCARSDDLFEGLVQDPNGGARMNPFVATRDVRKQFATVTAVAGVSLEVGERQVFALLGPNGAGKTTLLRMLLGLMHPDSGTIEYAGGRRTPPRHETGYLPEDRGLYADVQVLRTLEYFGVLRGMERRAARIAAEGWLERMSLGDRRREALKALSKGNQQKVQFISAVLHSPKFAVLDEPFSGLDPLNQELFLQLIRELRDAGTTVLLSAHQMQLVERIADSIVVLNRGHAVLTGTVAEIRRRWTTGNRLRIRTGSPPPPDLFAGLATVELTVHGDNELEIFVADGEPLGPLLAEVGATVDVRGIESHPVTLHDVYVGTIARHDSENTAGGAL
jgi:ABC-2 type transport system ATP-binding protein